MNEDLRTFMIAVCVVRHEAEGTIHLVITIRHDRL
jgi:hypothetical protein